MSNYTHYTHFLKDKHFIRWQLTPNKELDIQWHDFIQKNPSSLKALNEAIDYLRTTGLNNNTFSKIEREKLLNEIQLTIARNSKKRKIRKIIQLSVASCAAIALIVIGSTLFQKQNSTTAPEQELIVGSLLSNEDIKLITGKESLSFQNDVQVEFDKDGTAKVIQGDNAKRETVKLAKSEQNTLIVPYGKRSTLTLSDGSKVWLNSGSVLEFPAQFTDKNREIRLASGEMYIEVAPDKRRSFYVHTSNFNVKVYGTKFNISAYSESVSAVVLVEGSVSLKSKNNNEVFINPYEQAVYKESGAFETQKVDVNQFISWKDGYVIFEDTPISDVLKYISRYYNLSFDYKDTNLQKRTCTGKIYLFENLDKVMTTIATLSSTTYKKNGNQIFITREANKKH
ncbi:MAG: FecR domain-containing protein [Bacteroidia bacterium]|nr:FecR domain-containing protein [Bacteroidia bacterium]